MPQGVTKHGITWTASGTPRRDQPSLLFIHGAGASSTIWWQQFEAFSSTFHCVAYDLAGFGGSQPTAAVDLRAELVNAAEDVLDAAGAQTAHIVCQSLGGWTGLRMALDLPERVSSLVLSCTLAGIAHAPGLVAFQQATSSMGVQGPASLGLSHAFEAAQPLKAALYRQLGALNPKQDPSLAQRLFEPAFLVPISELARVTVPTLILTATDDRIWPPASLSELPAHFHNGQYRVIDGSGHSPYFERPDLFNKELADFIART